MLEKTFKKTFLVGASAAALLGLGVNMATNGATVHAADQPSSAQTSNSSSQTPASSSQLANSSSAQGQSGTDQKKDNTTPTDAENEALKKAETPVDTKQGNPKVDYTKLDSAIKDAQDMLKKDGFTKSTKEEKENFVNAINKAKDVRETADGTQAQADNAADLLTKRQGELSGTKLKEGNKANLQNALAKAKAIKSTDAYNKDTDANKKLFDQMVEKAQEIADNKDASQTEIDTATNGLNRAMDQLNANQATRDKQAEERAKKIKESYPDQKPANGKDGKDGKDGANGKDATAGKTANDKASYPKQADTASYPDKASYPARLPQTGEAKTNALGIIGTIMASVASLGGAAVVTKKKIAG